MSEYIAQETVVSVLGVQLQGYKTKDGSVVYSQVGTAKGLGIARSTLQNALKVVRGLASLKALTGEPASHSNPNNLASLKVYTASGVQNISTITKPELILLVEHLASKGDAQAKALVTASFAVVLQQSEDEAYQIERSRSEYLEAGAKLREELFKIFLEAQATIYLQRDDEELYQQAVKQKAEALSAMTPEDRDKAYEIENARRKKVREIQESYNFYCDWETGELPPRKDKERLQRIRAVYSQDLLQNKP